LTARSGREAVPMPPPRQTATMRRLVFGSRSKEAAHWPFRIPSISRPHTSAISRRSFLSSAVSSLRSLNFIFCTHRPWCRTVATLLPSAQPHLLLQSFPARTRKQRMIVTAINDSKSWGPSPTRVRFFAETGLTNHFPGPLERCAHDCRQKLEPSPTCSPRRRCSGPQPREVQPTSSTFPLPRR